MKNKIQKVKTIKSYSVTYKGYLIIIPVGSIVTNQTATGADNNYRFWIDWQKTAEELTGFKDSMLAHDLTYYGINIPQEYCEPYEE